MTSNNTATSENAFFIEREEVFSLINTLSVLQNSTTQGIKISHDDALRRLRAIVDKYLECPTLLDPHLESMVHRLILPARAIVHDLFLSQFAEDCENKNENENGTPNIDKLSNLMHLLSAIYAISKVRGRKYIQRLMPHDAIDVEPVLTTLRWFGWIERQERGLGNSSDDDAQRLKIPNCIQLLKHQQNEATDCEAKLWESIHSLLTWLGIISLVPFDLHSIDSSLEGATNDNSGVGNSVTLVQSIVRTSASHLGDYGATRETAAACLASLLSRPDLQDFELEGFVKWSIQILHCFRNGQVPVDVETTQLLFVVPEDTPTIFLVMGVLQTLVTLVKTGHRSNLLSTEQKLKGIEKLWEQAILTAESSAAGSVILRKLFVKLFARIGCAHLPPRVATWRYQRGKRSLVENLMNGMMNTQKNDDTNSICQNNKTSLSNDDLFFVPDQVEDAADQLLRCLTDPATIVRWSAAKGIGRLTERLPAICADDVLDAILKICSDLENDRAWHGACLALAELARRGLLLPERLRDVVPIVVRAIGYDIRRGQHSVGTHVRDAACYTCWAFARAYEPSVLKPHVSTLSAALVLTSLFDREVNCRRAASAAFQESVGRQGADSFLHGIEILTTADYFSLGNRNESFLNIAFGIAKFEEYRTVIIRHLSDVKLIHWDRDIRQLSAKSLAQIAKLCPAYCASAVLPKLIEQCFHNDIVIRHGSLIGCAELVLVFGELNMLHDGGVMDDKKTALAELVPSIEKARLYRGRGGEIMRAAACRMIECLCRSGLPLTVKQQVRLLDSVDACLQHPNEDIQNNAAEALRALLCNHFPVGEKGPSTRLQNRVVDKYVSVVRTEDNAAATRGFSLALGVLPAKLLAPTHEVLDSVLECLCYALAKESLVGGEGDAETRRNSIISLVNVCKTVGFERNENMDANPSPICPLTRCQANKVFESLLLAMEDYSTDRRGDVGSWSRIAAMKGLETLSYLAIESSNTFPRNARKIYSSEPSYEEAAGNTPSFKKRAEDFLGNDHSSSSEKYMIPQTYFDEELCSSIVCALLKQLGEKLDVVRCQAGGCLERLLTAQSPRIPFVSHRAMLIQALRVGEESTNWSNAAATFPLLMRAINIEGYFSSILEGIIVSVGGLTESVSKNSSASLFEWVRVCRQLKATQKLLQMGEVFLELFCRFKRNGRVLLPLLSTLDKLLSHGYLEELLILNNGSFIVNLMVSLANEVNGCSDVKRLLAIVKVSLNMIQLDLDTAATMRESILPLVMTMLLNPYPRVRQFTAEELYVKIEEDGDRLFDNQSSLENVTQLLLNVVWNDEYDHHGHIVKSRNQVADLMGVSLPEEARRVKIGTADPRAVLRDEFASYASLVKSA